MSIRHRDILSKTAAAVSAAAMICTASAYAQTAQTGNSEIKSSGTVSAKPGERVTLDVYYPGKTPADLIAAAQEDYTKILLYRDETAVGKNGEYEFSFNVGDIKTDEYTAYISGTSANSAEDVTVEKFIYRNPNDYIDAIAALNKAKSAEDVKAVIDEYSLSLGISMEGISESEASAIYKIMASSLSGEKLDTKDVLSAQKCFGASKLIFELNSKKSANIDASINMLDLTQCGLDTWYTKDYVSEEVQKNMTSRLSGKNIGSIKELYELMPQAYILGVVQKSGSIAAVKEVINGFSEEIGANANGISERSLSSISGQSFADLSALKSAISDAKSGSGNGGGGSSGSGSSGGTKGYPTESNSTGQNTDIELNYYVFDDLDDVQWARESICKLAEMGVLRGKEYRKFYPNDMITREEFVKMLVTAYNIDTEGKTCGFADVRVEDWFCPYVSAAYDAEIVKGVSDDSFGVGINISRQDLAVMAFNAAQKSGMSFREAEKVPFADDEYISDYASDAVYALKTLDIINGKDGRNFAPQDTATRAEAAKILYLLVSLGK